MGFLKAFSDQPEHITSGMSPLRTIMKELQLRTVHIYPRSVYVLVYPLRVCLHFCYCSTHVSCRSLFTSVLEYRRLISVRDSIDFIRKL